MGRVEGMEAMKKPYKSCQEPGLFKQKHLPEGQKWIMGWK